MLIVGLHNDCDSGVCLIKDGVLVEALNEERLSRVKLHDGFPGKSLAYLLEKYDLHIEDVDHFAYGWSGCALDYPHLAEKIVERTIQALERNPNCGNILKRRMASEVTHDSKARTDFEAEMKALGIPSEKIAYLDHHKSHAWSAFACSPFDEALVFTFDGRGDLRSASVSYGSEKTGLDELGALLTIDSLGYLYGQITHHLGFTPHRHEGKITGLAARGNAEKTLPLFRKLFAWVEDGFQACVGPYEPFFDGIAPELKALYDAHCREDLAAGVQAMTEELVTSYVAHWIKKVGKSGCKNICLAGGVAANVRVNQCVAELPGVDNIFVFPHMGDGGLAVGAACHLHHQLSGTTKVALPDIYLGPSFDDHEIFESLSAFSETITFTKMDDKIETVAADLLAERVVGYFDGRMELGPRALGARSILYSARDADVNDWLNKRMHRTEFMPFAPVTTEEDAPDCYLDWRKDHLSAQFMTRTYNCSQSFKDRHKAVVHVDGTARPQIVTQALHGDYYKIVRTYCEKSGDKALINTSFNQHEEPIVCAPQDAINSLVNDTVDVLIIGNYRAVRR
jgi:carbamoyltransferase